MTERKRGRPTKRGKGVEDRVLKLLRNGNTRSAAAYAAGIDPSTLRRWCSLSKRFCAATIQAEAEAETLYVNALTTNAVSGDTKAIVFYLTHRRGDDWRPPKETRVIEGNPDAPLEVVERMVYRSKED